MMQFGHTVNPSPSMGEGVKGGRGKLVGSITPTLTRPHQGGGNALNTVAGS
jgi:hypothetical protein